jgi:hypothetical protein
MQNDKLYIMSNYPDLNSTPQQDSFNEAHQDYSDFESMKQTVADFLQQKRNLEKQGGSDDQIREIKLKVLNAIDLIFKEESRRAS